MTHFSNVYLLLCKILKVAFYFLLLPHYIYYTNIKIKGSSTLNQGHQQGHRKYTYDATISYRSDVLLLFVITKYHVSNRI